jgi:hypothetical protein
MRFHAILFARDEEDIIGECLHHNSQWCNNIYVFDTGSTDQTWEIVNECSKKLPQVKPVRKTPIWFSDTLRALVFEEFRHEADEGDWWVRLDADEFYHVSPREFVKTLAPRESAIFHAYYNFVLTEEEVERLSDRTRLISERRQPIQQRRRYFMTSFDYSEPRLFKYRKSMQWNPYHFGPYNAGYVAKRRIPIRHYPHRDPLQMERRYRLRHTMISEMEGMYDTAIHHWSAVDWQQAVISLADPRVKLWNPPQEDLPECNLTNHLPGRTKRAIQWFVHRFFLPVLDRSRSVYPREFHPKPIPDVIQARLKVASQSSIRG